MFNSKTENTEIVNTRADWAYVVQLTDQSHGPLSDVDKQGRVRNGDLNKRIGITELMSCLTTRVYIRNKRQREKVRETDREWERQRAEPNQNLHTGLSGFSRSLLHCLNWDHTSFFSPSCSYSYSYRFSLLTKSSSSFLKKTVFQLWNFIRHGSPEILPLFRFLDGSVFFSEF